MKKVLSALHSASKFIFGSDGKPALKANKPSKSANGKGNSNAAQSKREAKKRNNIRKRK